MSREGVDSEAEADGARRSQREPVRAAPAPIRRDRHALRRGDRVEEGRHVICPDIGEVAMEDDERRDLVRDRLQPRLLEPGVQPHPVLHHQPGAGGLDHRPERG